MNSTIRCAPLLLSTLISSTALQAANPQEPPPLGTVSYLEVANLLAEESRGRNAIENALANIKSRTELSEYLRVTPTESNPLERLTPRARQRFIRSLTFNENGLTGFDYQALSRELTASEIYQVLSLFGAQHITAQVPQVRTITPLDRAIMGVIPQAARQPQLAPRSDAPDVGTSSNGGGDNEASDHIGYKCESKGTCETAAGYICTSNC